MEIYVLIDNQPQGPYSLEQVREYIKSGQLQPTDLAAPAGSADWKPLSTFIRPSETQVPGKGRRFSAAATTSKRKKPSKKSPASAVLVLVVIVLVGAGGFLGWKHFYEGKRGAKVTTPPEAGWPNTLAEFNAWYAEVPEGQNAASFFVKGFEAMQVTNADWESKDLPLMGKGTLPPAGSPLPAKTKAAMVALIQRNKTAWEAFQQGAKLEQARYPMDLNKGYETPLPHLAKIKPAVQLSGIVALALADGKQPKLVVDALLNGHAITGSLKNEPILISQLMRATSFTIEKTNLEAVVNLTKLPPAELERLATALAKTESEESAGTPFTRAMVGERVSCLSIMNLPPKEIEELFKSISGGIVVVPGEESERRKEVEIKTLLRNLKAERAFSEETFNRALVIRKQAFPERLKGDEYFTARIDEARTNEFELCLVLMPYPGTKTRREAVGLANLRLMQTAVALERYRLANNNSYPAALTALVPQFLTAVTQDPFDGQPLRYERSGEGYKLHSIGDERSKAIPFTVVKPPK